jgi:hypothetical protein|nr:MAG TPA: hypothetical protein [Caudoviricetes sp.]
MNVTTNHETGFLDQIFDVYEDLQEIPFFRSRWIVLDILIVIAAFLC